MRRITMWLFSTVAALVLLFSYRTSTNDPAQAGTAQAVAEGPAATSTTSAGSAPQATSGTSPTSSGDTKTYSGSIASTRWGDVQVVITVAGGRITDVAVPLYPTENRKDQQINARALPVLRQETLSAQNADIDTVSGATVTSNGYRESLQSALDAAHLG